MSTKRSRLGRKVDAARARLKAVPGPPSNVVDLTQYRRGDAHTSHVHATSTVPGVELVTPARGAEPIEVVHLTEERARELYDRAERAARLLAAERPREGRADFRTDPDPELAELERQGYVRAERADEGDTCTFRRKRRVCGAAAVWRILDGCYCDAHGVKVAKDLDRKTPKMTIPRKVKR